MDYGTTDGLVGPQTSTPAASSRWLNETLERALPADRAAAAPADESSADRRGDDRAKTSIYRSALLRSSSIETFCLIRNISSGGLMCEVPVELAPESRISIEMRSGQSIGARVVWCRDKRIGVEFEHKVDVPALLASLREESGGWKPRMPRLVTHCPATLEIDDETGQVLLTDLSQGGARIDGIRATAGEPVTLTVEGLEPRRGVVRWANNGQAGIGFLRAIPFDMLARWTIDYRPVIEQPPEG